PVQAIAFSPDGGLLACLAGDEATAWDVETGRRRARRPLPEQEGRRSLALHPWRAVGVTGAERETSRRGPAGDRGGAPVAGGADVLAFDPDGRTLWGAGKDEVRSWRWSDGEAATHWRNGTLNGLNGIYALAVGRRWVLAGGRDGSARLLRPDEGQPE